MTPQEMDKELTLILEDKMNSLGFTKKRIPCKSHMGDLRVLAAIGQPVRTHGAVSGTKAMGIDPKK